MGKVDVTYKGRTKRSLHRYRSRITELKAALDEKWIPVAERLPDDDLTVLIALKDSDEPVWLGWHDSDGGWCTVDAVPVKVTHWQPMPEAPNG